MKNQTMRYSATQFTFWAASTGAASFAATYLLGQGVASETVGLLLAAAGLLSCLTQPILAGMADRVERFVLRKVMLAMSLVCVLCFAAQLFPGIPVGFVSLFYMAGIWCSDAMVPMLNALYISYTQAGYPIHYGAARGVGSMASALSSLTVGFIIAKLGSTWMILFLAGFRLLSIAVLLSYPTIEKTAQAAAVSEKSCSVVQFFSQYCWYCVSLLGILFLGMYHAMTENYLITILGRLGGDSSHVGKALFISSMAGAVVIFFIDRIRRFLSDACLLKISACTFLLKSVLFYFAGSIGTIYLLQLLQMTSYAFLGPIQVYYARAKVRQADMVKGQAFVTAAYALGCSAGNFAGGQLLPLGVDAILMAGIIMAAAGTLILFLTVNRMDSNE